MRCRTDGPAEMSAAVPLPAQTPTAIARTPQPMRRGHAMKSGTTLQLPSLNEHRSAPRLRRSRVTGTAHAMPFGSGQAFGYAGIEQRYSLGKIVGRDQKHDRRHHGRDIRAYVVGHDARNVAHAAAFLAGMVGGRQRFRCGGGVIAVTCRRMIAMMRAVAAGMPVSFVVRGSVSRYGDGRCQVGGRTLPPCRSAGGESGGKQPHKRAIAEAAHRRSRYPSSGLATRMRRASDRLDGVPEKCKALS